MPRPPEQQAAQEGEHTISNNLRQALTSLKSELLRLGYKSVDGLEFGYAKEINIEEFPINLPDTIPSIAVIELNFRHTIPEQDKTVNINCWRIEADHLSGPASANEFRGRIKQALGIR